MHKTLNHIYNRDCKPGYKKYQKISKDILLIEDFFENFDGARNFFRSMDTWDSNAYQGNSLMGYQSYMPSWIGKSLLENYFIDHKKELYESDYETITNFFYNIDKNNVLDICNSGYFPHVDKVFEENDMRSYICLVNLNNFSVCTNFYTYKDNENCYGNNLEEWKCYMKKVQSEVIYFYGKNNINGEEVKIFLENKKDLKIKKIREVEYKPNQAILYKSSLYHSPKIGRHYSYDDPRVLLRIQCYGKEKNKFKYM
jgi:hypothetical protein